jgi:hypothetical protein
MSTNDVATKLAEYLRVSIENEPKWHYRQYRPMILGVPPNVEQDADCSSQATQAYYFAGAPDPNHEAFSGYGYTGTLINNPQVSEPFEIGDLGIYGPSRGATSHVVTCFQDGNSSTAIWCSHGSERAPYPVRLHYRSDLLTVVRPGLGDGEGGGGDDDVSVPEWFWDWSKWYLDTSRDPAKRPEDAPEKIPKWAWEMNEEVNNIAYHHGMSQHERNWITWWLGGKEGEKPESPTTIPEFWWDDAKYVKARP